MKINVYTPITSFVADVVAAYMFYCFPIWSLSLSQTLSLYVSGRKDTGLLGERKKRKREKESKKWNKLYIIYWADAVDASDALCKRCVQRIGRIG